MIGSLPHTGRIPRDGVDFCRGALIGIFIVAILLGLFVAGLQIGISHGRQLQERETTQEAIRAAQYAQDLQDCRDGVGRIGRRR